MPDIYWISRGWATPEEEAPTYLQKFCPKLHEMKEFGLGGGGGGRPWHPYLGSATALIPLAYILLETFLKSWNKTIPHPVSNQQDASVINKNI